MATQKLLGIQLNSGGFSDNQPRYRKAFKNTHFEYERKEDFKDAFQMTFLTDVELAKLLNTTLEDIQYFRKFKKFKL
jgi:hypothetical protein